MITINPSNKTTSFKINNTIDNVIDSNSLSQINALKDEYFLSNKTLKKSDYL